MDPPELAGVEHRYARVGSLRIHYAEAGDGEPLVLQHGWPQHWWMWRELIGPLAERHRVICPDLRGFGWSDAPPGEYRKAQLADDLVGLLDTLGLGRVRLAGHDWGAYVGFLVCLSHPDRVSRFMPMSIPPPWPGRRSIRLMWMLGYQGVLAAPVLGELAVRRLGFAGALLRAGRAAGSFSDAELEAYLAPLRRPGSAHASSRMYRTFLLRELTARAPRLTTPTHLMIGERDPLAWGLAASYARHADDLRVERVPGAGHFLPEERPDVVLHRMLELL